MTFDEWWERAGEAKAESEALRKAWTGGGVADYQNCMLFAFEAGHRAGLQDAADLAGDLGADYSHDRMKRLIELVLGESK